ncbi:rhamnogalacturonan acetylesterase RgaE [Aspergillus clavatus NRRL 1]|uniref:Rhamnogalacturonan acetylesterase, putative n=1 Tax=Aspergillus clavatus (strain ATCC 1007 / CBS 513.65 / DSM 816 / NCTC 3887 / NRRL 1 / QM 1276 / 107) TaxID=344612 RepID=A1CLF1_ASPCL|nr:rhamnogalacturonan acetylesterase, putative [Aspergillus clavatus NRRL 1]EAW09975.1 rhamnogalacturonan acetylesterase, putative [Aspergillus clavatus NRRL 1]
MKTLALLSSLALLPGTLGATLYLAGDSTMARAGGGHGTDGWGQYISSSVSASVSNKAMAGRSARSYTREGRFQAIADVLQQGDYVVIEFGHNDGGSLSTRHNDNGRTDCAGTGGETCRTVYNGVTETVLTFPKYLENAARMFQAKGAKVLIASQTPNNPWETGSFAYAPSRFVGYAQLAARVAGVDYVDHGAYVADILKSLGLQTVDSYFPNDHTHTSAKGAQVVANAFLKAVACSSVALKDILKTTDFQGKCL